MTTTRMTKAMRASAVEAVIASSDLTKQLKALKDASKTKAAESIKAAWPQGFANAIKQYPASWFASVVRVSVPHTHQHSKTKVNHMINTPCTGALYYEGIQLSDPIPWPHHFPEGIEHYKNLTLDWVADEYAPKYQAITLQIEELTRQTSAMFEAYSTVEKLLKDAPQLAHFFKAALPLGGAVMLPVGNILDLMKSTGVKLIQAGPETASA